MSFCIIAGINIIEKRIYKGRPKGSEVNTTEYMLLSKLAVVYYSILLEDCLFLFIISS